MYAVACRLNDGVWFTNRNDLAYFRDHGLVYADRAVLTRNYLDTDAYAPDVVPADDVAALREELGLAAGARVVVMVARMIWSKGIREFAEAAERLRATHPHTAFLLVAPLEDGHFDAVPEGYIRSKERTANVRWLGFRRDVKRIYALSDLAVLPSYYKEGGYPRALLEPMSMGKPIITTDSVDCREPVEPGRNGYLVPVRDSAALADAIARLLDDDDCRIAFGTYSREKAVREFEERIIVRTALEALDVLPRVTGEVPTAIAPMAG
jgi:N,N'-diacetylbacillosaminyl-diphospho-undecaprenol alpha-1,3-N-acetylgalactosaminyltransferase